MHVTVCRVGSVEYHHCYILPANVRSTSKLDVLREKEKHRLHTTA